MFAVYSKEKISKKIFDYIINKEELETMLGGDIFKDHPDLNKEDYIVVEQEMSFAYPTYRVEKSIIEEMTLMERYKNGLYELGLHEVEYKGDIITLEAGQYIDEKGVLQTIPKIEGTRVEWNWEINEWEEKATNLEVVQAQYRDYEGMDTPSTLEEMKQQDPALATEYLNMMIELRGLIYTLSTSETQAVGYAILPIPQPSEALKEFKNKFKLTK